MLSIFPPSARGGSLVTVRTSKSTFAEVGSLRNKPSLPKRIHFAGMVTYMFFAVWHQAQSARVHGHFRSWRFLQGPQQFNNDVLRFMTQVPDAK